MSNAERKIRIGSFDYPLPFLQNLIDSVRDEHTSFASDLLRVWENNELTRLQEIERNIEREAIQRQLDHEQQTQHRDD